MEAPNDDAIQPSDTNRAKKRRRTGLACSECRDRKRKCDGKRPTCGSCEKRKPKPACIYTDETLKRGSSSYVQTLRDRIRELESQVGLQTPHSAPPEDPQPEAFAEGTGNIQLDGPALSIGKLVDNSGGKSQADQRTFSLDQNRHFASTEIATDTSSVFHTASDSDLESDNENTGEHWVRLDGMGPQEGTPPPDRRVDVRESLSYFGPSSVFGFMRQVHQTISEPSGETQSFVVSLPVHEKGGQARLQSVVERVPISLPTRAEADALVEGYFAGVHTLYPFLHRPTFQAQYVQVWEPVSARSSATRSRLGSEDRMFYALLNAVFALGVHFTAFIEPQERVHMSELYFQRCMGMVHFSMLAEESIELVQTLLLMSQYLQSTDMPGLCWNIVGLAIRVGQSIGLHIPRPASGRKEDALVAEIRKRCWGGCVTLDRVLAMVYGRPLMIHPSLTADFTFPELDDDHIPTPGLGRSDGVRDDTSTPRDLKISAYVHSLKLILLLGEILQSFYSRSESSSTSPHHSTFEEDLDQNRLQRLLKLDADLVKLQQDWPKSLQLDGGHTSQPSRQAVTIRARYLHIRVFLLRPFMLVLYRKHRLNGAESPETSVEEMIVKNTLDQVTNTCLAATEELIDLIWARTMNASTDSSFAWSWWYSVFYIYSCATVIHVARLFYPLHIGAIDEESLRRSWQKCIQCLQNYSPFGQAARRCRKALILLEKQLKAKDKGLTKHGDASIAANVDGSPSQAFQISPSGDLDFLGNWDTLQFDTTFGLTADPMTWS